MPKSARTPTIAGLSMGQFSGLLTNADFHDLPAGALQTLSNITTLVPGQLQVRKGVQPSTAFTPASPTTNDFLAIFGASRPEGNIVYGHDSGGNLKAFRSAAATTLASSLAVDKPGCFAKHRRGLTIFVNGRERGYIHNGTGSTAWPLGVTAPSGTPTMTGASGGGASAGVYSGFVRYLDADTPIQNPSSISTIATVTLTASQKVVWTAFPASSEARVTAPGGMFELWRSTVDETNVYYRIAQTGHTATIASSANNTGTVRYTTALPHNFIVGTTGTVASHSVGGYNLSGVIITAVTQLTFDVDTAFSSTGTGGTFTTTGFNADTSTDLVLQSAAFNDERKRLVLVAGTEIVARRFTPPPNYKCVAVNFQDRMLYLVDDLYDTGTISTTAGSATVTGSGTAWTTAMAGRYLYCKDIPEPILISSVGSATSITASAPVSTNTSGKAYGIRPRPDVHNAILYSEIDEPESVPFESDGRPINIITAQELTNDDDEITGGIPFGAVFYVGKERHIYTLTFFDQPKLDASVSLLAERGLLNQRCWKTHEGQIYILDRQGAYILGVDGSVSDISEPIRNRFRGTTIDWSAGKWFHVGIDPIEEQVYFFVKYTGDTGTRPRRVMVFNIRNETWDDYVLPWDIGDNTRSVLSNKPRLLLGGEDDAILLMNEGTTDYVTAQYLATITSASSSTTLTASAAAFTTAMQGAPVVVISGTGKFTYSRVVTRDSATQLTIASALTVGTDSVIMIGGIPCVAKFGIFEVPEADIQNDRGIDLVFAPTSGDSTLDVRYYSNHDTSPENSPINDNGRGTYITRTASDPNHVLNVRSDRLSGTTAAGFDRFTWSGRLSGLGQGKHWFTPELRWVAGDYSPVIYDVRIRGAENGSK